MSPEVEVLPFQAKNKTRKSNLEREKVDRSSRS